MLVHLPQGEHLLTVPHPTPLVLKRNMVNISIDPYDGDLNTLVADFTDQLTQVLVDNGISDAAIRVIDILNMPDNE